VTCGTGRRSAGALVISLLVVSLTIAQSATWRAEALASFDEVWQTVNDTYYDPSFDGVDWPAAKNDLRPRVMAAASPEAAREVIRELLARLKRSHFVLLTATADDMVSGPALVPIEMRIAAGEAVITAVTDRKAADAGLKPGFVIVSIDGKPVTTLLQGVDAPDSRSRALQGWRHVSRELYGSDGSRATLRVRGEDARERAVTVDRVRPSGQVVEFGNLPPLHVVNESKALTSARGKHVGYIKFNYWMVPINEPVALAVDRFRQSDGIIVDLRGNPGGLASMMSGIAGHFIAEPVLLGTMKTRQTPQPLSYRVNPRIVTSDGRRVNVFAGRLAILVDELTGSTSETFTGALQSLGRARVFGRQTMGQALPAVTKRLPSGDVFMYALGDFTTSTGRSLEGSGVTPDVLMDISRRALLSGRDADIDAALAWIDAGKPSVSSEYR
jgi:carboxyl-terminal processing protease